MNNIPWKISSTYVTTYKNNKLLSRKKCIYMAKYMNKKENQIKNKYMKGCPISLVIRKMKTEN